MKNFYSFFDITVQAGEVYRVNNYSHFITLLSSNGAQNIMISIGGQAMQELPAGISVELPQDQNFTYLEFKNNEAVPVKLTFSLSSGAVSDNRSVISGIVNINDITAAATGSLNVEGTVGTAEATALAANANRKSFSIQANPSNTDKIYVSFMTGVDLTHYKVILEAGQYFSSSQWKGAVYVYGGAAGQKFCIQEETV